MPPDSHIKEVLNKMHIFKIPEHCAHKAPPPIPACGKQSAQFGGTKNVEDLLANFKVMQKIEWGKLLIFSPFSFFLAPKQSLI